MLTNDGRLTAELGDLKKMTRVKQVDMIGRIAFELSKV